MSVRCRLPGVIFCGVLAALTNIRGAGADVFNMPSGDTSMQFVNVGDPGNTGDTQKMNGQNLIIGGSDDTSSGYGAVSYSYAMSTFDVTAAQYVQFLDAVATKSDPYGLYNPLMGGATLGPASSDPSDPQGTTIGWVTVSSGGKTWPVVCGITRTGTAGNYSYAVSTSAAANLGSPPIPADSGNFPVNWINFGDAVRFCNWLENGQPTGGTEGVGTTETGSYTLNGAMTIAQLFGLTHNSGRKILDPHGERVVQGRVLQGRRTQLGLLVLPHAKQLIQPAQFHAFDHRHEQRQLQHFRRAVAEQLDPDPSRLLRGFCQPLRYF